MARAPETHVPPDSEPPARCPHCGRPFSTVHLKRLHVGEVHPDEASELEREEYEAALDEERDRLFGYQLRVTIALGVSYALLVIALMVVLGGGP
jgi:hypothetical protein